MNLKRTTIKIGIVPLKQDDGEYGPFPYLLEQYSEGDDAVITFGGEESKETFSLFRDKDMKVIKPDDDPAFFESIYSGLDSMHTSVEAASIDSLTRDLSEAKKLAARSVLSANVKISKDSIEKSLVKLFDVPGDLGFIMDKNAISNINEKQKKAIDGEINKQINMFKSTSSGGSAITSSLLDRYAFKKPIMLVGGAGEGKTFMLGTWIMEHRDELGLVDFHADGHEGFEIPDMLGMMVPNETGGMSWIDGPVTQAFRSASRGNKTVLFMDEILRIPDKERSLLIGALIPKADGFLSLRTNRIKEFDTDGVGVTEEIKCKPENLWVVAASNIGTGFSVDDMDIAFQDRFRTFRVENGSELVKMIAKKICKEKSFPESLAIKIVSLYEQFHEIKDKGVLQKSFSARHISEVLTLAEELSDVGQLLQDLEYTVLSINSSGKINKAEKEIWDTLIEFFL